MFSRQMRILIKRLNDIVNMRTLELQEKKQAIQAQEQHLQLELQAVKQKLELQLRAEKQKLEAEDQRLQLDLEIGKARAREEVFAAEVHQDSHPCSTHSANQTRNLFVNDNIDINLNDNTMVTDNVNNLLTNDHVPNVAQSVHTIYHDFADPTEAVATQAPVRPSYDDHITHQPGFQQQHPSMLNPSSLAAVTARAPVRPSYDDHITHQPGFQRPHLSMLNPSSFAAVTTQASVRPSCDDHIHQPGFQRPHLSMLNPSSLAYQPRLQPPDRGFDYQESLQRLVSAMTLPQPEVPKFRGDPMDFHTFIMAFDARIVSRTTNYSDRLYYLDQHLVGEAKDLVGGCLHMEPMAGYMEARALLQKEYGNAYTVSSAYVDKVLTWPNIRHDDSTALRKLGLFLVRCNKAMRNITNMDVLNHLPNLQTIVTKLPGYLQNKWRDHASRLRRNEQRVANFNDLTCFVESASESANDPVFGKFALNKCTQSGLPSGRAPSKGTHDNKAKSSNFAVAVNESSHHTRSTTESQTNSQPVPYKGLCYYCHKSHDIDYCPDFNKLSIEDKRSYIKDKKMCFACYGQNHISKGCLRKRTCRVCGKNHPTSLHMTNFQPFHSQADVLTNESKPSDTVQAFTCVGNTDASMVLHAIIPVKVRQRKGDITVTTYAFYDNGSSGCFLTENLKAQLNADGQETTLLLHTMQGPSHMKSTAITDLVVSGINGENPIELPRCFTTNEIPVNHSHIPKPNMLSRWSHLHEATSEMPPYLPGTPIGLLIGNNCVRAHQPSKVIPSSGDGPFAALYPHGWTINGPLHTNYEEDGSNQVAYCNHINVQEINVSETFTPKSIFRMLDADVSDLCIANVSGKLRHSQHDISFMKIAEGGIAYNDGQYVLPMPFRSPDVHMPNNYADNTEIGKPLYLPHHGVYPPTTSNKLIFDCRAKFDGTSLKNHLLQLSDLTNSIVCVPTRFHQEPIAIMGDTESMCHQIRDAVEPITVLHFLWWQNGNMNSDIVEYIMVAHLFAATSSPSIIFKITCEECSKDTQTRSQDYDDLHLERALGVHWSILLKVTIIPHLQLTTVTVAVWIGLVLSRELEIKFAHVKYHTDSARVLHYIFNVKKRFPKCVANNVQFIRDHSNTNHKNGML